MNWEDAYVDLKDKVHRERMADQENVNFLKAQLYESWKAVRAANRGVKRLRRRLDAREAELAEWEQWREEKSYER